jgi:uncharacterized protein YbjT (DUF2867 family)
MPSNLITVFGATGVQGGSVTKALLSHPILCKTHTIRAITRDPTKPSARDLASQGVETVRADLSQADSILQAIQGSYAVFAVTNYWEKQSKSLEIQQGKLIADSCKAAGVRLLIWSALPHVTQMTNGVLKAVEHFDSKAEVAEYIEQTKGPDMAATYFMPGFYMQNIKGMIRPDKNGVPTLIQPWDAEKTQVALFDAANDTGTFVAGILSQRDLKAVDGLRVQACSQWLTPNEIVNTLNKVAGTKVKFQQVPEDTFESLLPPAVAEEMTQNMVLVRDYSYFGLGSEKNQAEHDKILGGLKKTTWEQFVRENGPWKWGDEGEKGLYDNL